MKTTIKRVGIMVSTARQRKRVLRTYRKVSPRGIKLFTFTPSSINWMTKKINGLHYANNKFQTKWFSFPNIMYNRCYGADRRLLQRIERIIGKNKCFNHVNHFDKEFTYRLLCNTEVKQHLPVTIPYHEAILDDLLAQYDTLYLKPVLGNRGKGVYRVYKADTGDIQISQHYFAPFAICRDPLSLQQNISNLVQSKEYLVQQGIPLMQIEKKNFDIRLLMQKGKTGAWGVTNAICRTAYGGCFNTSVCERVTPSERLLESILSPSELESTLAAITQVGLKTAQLIEENGKLHLGELSVDFGLDELGAPWIIEINGNPQRTMYKELHNYQDVYKNPICYAQFLMSKSNC